MVNGMTNAFPESPGPLPAASHLLSALGSGCSSTPLTESQGQTSLPPDTKIKMLNFAESLELCWINPDVGHGWNTHRKKVSRGLEIKHSVWLGSCEGEGVRPRLACWLPTLPLWVEFQQNRILCICRSVPMALAARLGPERENCGYEEIALSSYRLFLFDSIH